MATCTAHNGTYECQLEAPHTGRKHRNIRKEFNGRNEHVSTLISTFTDNYSTVRQVRRVN